MTVVPSCSDVKHGAKTKEVPLADYVRQRGSARLTRGGCADWLAALRMRTSPGKLCVSEAPSARGGQQSESTTEILRLGALGSRGCLLRCATAATPQSCLDSKQIQQQL